MAHLSDQVEAKIARANRAFRLSSRIIAATQQELESHGEWLDRHRTSWAEEVKRHRRLLNRKLALGAVTRFVVGLVFAAPFALARAVEWRFEPPASPAPRSPKAEPPFTRQAGLDLRIHRLEERLGATTADAPRARPEHLEKPTLLPRSAEGGAPAPPQTRVPAPTGFSSPAIAALALLISCRRRGPRHFFERARRGHRTRGARDDRARAPSAGDPDSGEVKKGGATPLAFRLCSS